MHRLRYNAPRFAISEYAFLFVAPVRLLGVCDDVREEKLGGYTVQERCIIYLIDQRFGSTVPISLLSFPLSSILSQV